MSNTVFVGNIPYEFTEEQLTDVFRQCGPVRQFRLVFDRDSGRPKGYGFCEYGDASSAQSALRNLDGYEISGRALRVSSDGDGSGRGNRASATPQPQSFPSMPMPPAMVTQPPLQSGGPPPPWAEYSRFKPSASPAPPAAVPPPEQLPFTAPPPGVSPQDAISNTLSSIPPTQLLDVIKQLRQVALSNPEQLESLLRQSPPLTYAILQALLLMNLIDASVVQKVVSGESVASIIAAGSQNAKEATPQPIQPARATPVDPNREALIKQIMSLSQAQVDALPKEQRDQVLAIRQQFTNRV
ncbi:hypothetical protein PYCC9005_003997 [Savitreella phatthalungensis]